MQSKLKAILIGGFVLGKTLHGGEVERTMQLIEVCKIWDRAPYNSFTDLIRFRDRWLCVFREAEAHRTSDLPAHASGGVRVISSADGKEWASEAAFSFTSDSYNKLNPKVPSRAAFVLDLRDPKLCVSPDGRLMLNAAIVYNGNASLQSLAWFSEDGKTWGQPILIGEQEFWLWKITWHKGVAYAVGRNQFARIPRLYRSADGTHFEVLAKDNEFFPHGPGPSEGVLRFLDDDTAVCLLRLNPGQGYRTDKAHLGMAKPPYTHWEWKNLGQRIGGPSMIHLADGRFVVGARQHLSDGTRTALFWLDPQSGGFTEALPLPSGGDSSYPGLVLHSGLLWVSYYSSHEGKTSIYLANVKVDH